MGAETQRKSFPPSTEVERVVSQLRPAIESAPPRLPPFVSAPRHPYRGEAGRLIPCAWSRDFDSRLVAAGGTLANLAAGMVFWIALRSTRSSSVRLRFFLLISLQPLWGHWIFLLFWDQQFRRLGGVESTRRKTAMGLEERKENS